MSHRSFRRIALVLVALLGFMQASIALAACTMDRGALGPVSADLAAMECGEPEHTNPEPVNRNLCLAHCTADLTSGSVPAPTVMAVSQTPLFILPRSDSPAKPFMHAQVPPPGMPPPRILLHSFLI